MSLLDPATPTQLHVTASGTNSIALTWTIQSGYTSDFTLSVNGTQGPVAASMFTWTPGPGTQPGSQNFSGSVTGLPQPGDLYTLVLTAVSGTQHSVTAATTTQRTSKHRFLAHAPRVLVT